MISNCKEHKELNKTNELLNYYDIMIEYCKIEKYIFLNQNWTFNDYSTILSCYNAKYHFNKFEKTSYQKEKNIRFSNLLNKISSRFLNIKNLKLLCSKLNIPVDNFNFYSEIILQSLILKKSEDINEQIIYKNIIKKLKKLNLEKKEFNKIIKFNNHTKYWNKKFKNSLKKEIYKDLNL